MRRDSSLSSDGDTDSTLSSHGNMQKIAQIIDLNLESRKNLDRCLSNINAENLECASQVVLQNIRTCTSTTVNILDGSTMYCFNFIFWVT